MIADGPDDGTLRPAGRLTPPPPSPELLAQVGGMKPVRPRSRFGGFLVALAACLVLPAITLVRSPWRPDLGALPPLWVGAGAALWGLAFVLTLASALIPRRGDVLPGAARAARVGGVSALALLLFALFATVSVPGVSQDLADVHLSLLQSCLDCGRFIFFASAILVLVGLVLLRRMLPVGGRRIGLALGVAGGAAGGLALFFVCPIAVTAHVVLGHIGGMAAGALLGGALFAGFVDR